MSSSTGKTLRTNCSRGNRSSVRFLDGESHHLDEQGLRAHRARGIRRLPRDGRPDAVLYLIDLAAYRDLTVPEGYENVYNVSGWSENVLEFIGAAEEPLNPIRDTEAFDPT